MFYFIIPSTQRSCWAILLVSLRPSICPASRVCSVAPTDLVGSISYFYILSSDFRCVGCNISCKISKIWIFGNFLNFVTLTLSCFDLGSDVNPWHRWSWGGGDTQNAGVLVFSIFKLIEFLFIKMVPDHPCYFEMSFIGRKYCKSVNWSSVAFLYPRPMKLEGGYTGFTLSVRLSVRPSVRLSVDDMVSGA